MFLFFCLLELQAQEFGSTIECASIQEFRVSNSEPATIIQISLVRENGTLSIKVEVSGIGDYEFALDSANGPYQNSPIFEAISPTEHTIYVRDKNGCGVVERNLKENITSEDFPSFFTPNGDGINDYWQYKPRKDALEINVETIWIFNRYGKLIAQINANSIGWNGEMNGEPMPSSDYWFKAVTYNGKEFYGHFSLKR